ncbi:hypothetical protein D3C85_399140 [compost metagenome]
MRRMSASSVANERSNAHRRQPPRGFFSIRPKREKPIRNSRTLTVLAPASRASSASENSAPGGMSRWYTRSISTCWMRSAPDCNSEISK